MRIYEITEQQELTVVNADDTNVTLIDPKTKIQTIVSFKILQNGPE